MCTDRRDFLRLSAGIAGATLLGNSLAYAHSESIEPQQGGAQPEAIRRLRRMTDNVVPITMEERKSRIDKAQRLMREQHIDAIYIEPGSSMFYYTGMRWGTSERMLAMVLPARGEIAWQLIYNTLHTRVLGESLAEVTGVSVPPSIAA